MEFIIPEEILHFARLYEQAGGTLYVVGGFVRNGILQVPFSDIDVCGALLPGKVLELCKSNNIRCIPKAIDFGTVEIHIGDEKFEYTTFRSDKYSVDGRHKPDEVRFSSSLECDAFRRDFACNAVYLDALLHTIYDPTNGIADIYSRVVRATSEDASIILRDDGLRLLRLVRFAAELGFGIEKNTYFAAKENIAHLKNISGERKRDELVKIVLSDTRYPELTRNTHNRVMFSLNALYELGALPYLLPELLEGENVLQNPRYHAHDVLRHNFYACAGAKPELTIRIAALLHDVGKPAALKEKGLNSSDGIIRDGKKVSPMLNHDILGVPLAREALTRLRFLNKFIDDVLFLVEWHMYDLNGAAKESTLRTRFAEFGYERSLMLCDIREADIHGSKPQYGGFVMEKWRNILARMKEQNAPFSLNELNCTGEDIMQWLNIGPSEKVGEVKLALLRHCARAPQDNTQKKLQQIAKMI